MAEKLGAGERFPKLTIDLTDGRSLALPDGLDGKYKVILFYRAHWCPYCRRQLASFEQQRAELEAVGARVIAASADPLEKAKGTAARVSFPIGYGVTRALADQVGAWWDERQGIAQPAQFLVRGDGEILASTYSSSAPGRITPEDVLLFIKVYESLPAK